MVARRTCEVVSVSARPSLPALAGGRRACVLRQPKFRTEASRRWRRVAESWVVSAKQKDEETVEKMGLEYGLFKVRGCASREVTKLRRDCVPRVFSSVPTAHATDRLTFVLDSVSYPRPADADGQVQERREQEGVCEGFAGQVRPGVPPHFDIFRNRVLRLVLLLGVHRDRHLRPPWKGESLRAANALALSRKRVLLTAPPRH